MYHTYQKKKKKCTTIIPCSRFSRKAHGPYKETKKVSNNVKKAQQRNSKSKNGVTLCPFKTVVLERVRESNDRVRRTYREPPESPTLILNFDVNYAVKALVEIAAEVGKKGWNFKVDPCSNESSWATPKSNSRPLYNNSLICDCSYPHGACHVVQLYVQLSFCYTLLILLNTIMSFRNIKSGRSIKL